jgi:hypothetical protein
VRTLDTKTAGLIATLPDHGLGFFSSRWYATAPLPPRRSRDRDVVIDLGKERARRFKEQTTNILADATNIADAMDMIEIATNARDPEAIDRLPAWAFEVLEAMGITDKFPGRPLRSLNASETKPLCACGCGETTETYQKTTSLAGVSVHVRPDHIGRLREKERREQQAALAPPSCEDTTATSGKRHFSASTPEPEPIARSQRTNKANGQAGNGHTTIGWDDQMPSPADVKVIDPAPTIAPEPKRNAQNKKSTPAAQPATESDQVEIMRRMVENGYSVTLCKDKGPRYDDWQRKKGLTFEQLMMLREDCRSGKATKKHPFPHDPTILGAHNDLMPCIDVDITMPEACEDMWIEIQDFFGDRGVLMKRTGKAPKFVVPVRTEGEFKQRTREFLMPNGTEGQIDLRGKGNQTVMFGVHPETGKPWTWLNDTSPLNVPYDELPLVTERDLEHWTGTIDLSGRALSSSRRNRRCTSAKRRAHLRRPPHAIV